MTQELQKCTQLVNDTILDQAAYIRASAEKKQLDLDKYKKQIRKEQKKKKTIQQHCTEGEFINICCQFDLHNLPSILFRN